MIPLWCKSNFSFLEGASHPEEYVETWHELAEGQPWALTDRDGVHGIVRAWARAKELGARVIYGSELTLEQGTLVVLARDHAAYRTLCKLITKGRLRSEKGKSLILWSELLEHHEGLILIWRDGLIRPVLPKVAWQLKEVFGQRFYAGLSRHYLDREKAEEERLFKHSKELGIRCVAFPQILYHSAQRRRLQDILRCIKHGVKIHEAGRYLLPNASFGLRPISEFQKLYEDRQDAIEATYDIASECTFNLSQIRYVYPSEDLPDGKTSMQWLRDLAFEGAKMRYPEGISDEALRQLNYELDVIEKLEYPGYFLTMWEIVNFCRTQHILCQGRGSAANSIVCFCLEVTAVDPIKMKLLFERFISLERAEPPDIDLDISHERREEVIQWVYQRYGRNRAAMVANMVRYRPRSAIRDVGKALGIPETSLDRMAKMLSYRETPLLEDIESAGLKIDGPTTLQLLELTKEIQEFPRHMSIHPGGFLLGHEPVHHLVPIENATMADRTVIQWDKYDVEALDLFKVDLLGLGALTHLNKSFELLRRHRGVDLSMATLPQDDPETYEMICRAETVGVFQIESRAQMAMLPRLRPQKFYDLVIEVGIVRPGPITGDMVHPYLRRRNGEEPVTYPHPSLEPVLEKTLGIPLFQEQVMKLAVVAADYTPGEADQLRRDMAAWRSKGRIDQHRERMIKRMCAKGIEVEFAERVFAQIQGFGEYGFPESHAASFALITYATAYMRAHWPEEFACGLLNSQPMGFYTSATIVDDAKRRGVRFMPVDINVSEWDNTMQPVGQEFAIRMGLRMIKGISEVDGESILAARERAPFASVRDFAARTNVNRGLIRRLAESGAFESLGLTRREALWDAQALDKGTLPLPFETTARRPILDELTPFEAISWDYQTSFHSPRGHPMQTIRQDLQDRGMPSANDLVAQRDGAWTHYAGMVICRQRPSTASGIVFMTMEDETGFVNVVVFPKVYEQYRILTKTQVFLGISGRVQNQYGVVHVLAEYLWIPRFTDVNSVRLKSRDFH